MTIRNYALTVATFLSIGASLYTQSPINQAAPTPTTESQIEKEPIVIRTFILATGMIVV